MAVKLVAFDMDGTMLTSDKKLPEGIEDEIRRLHGKGIAVAAASGRFFGTIRDMFPRCEGCLSCIGCNGHEIYRDGELVSLLSFSDETVLAAVRQARAHGGIVPVLFTSDKGYAVVEPGSDDWRPGIGEEEYGPLELVAEPVLDEPIIKISLFSPAGSGDTEEHMNALAEELPQDVKWVTTSAWTVDGCLDGMNKGRGLAILAGELGVRMEETMALGDHMNDLEMIVAAGEGVAMGNAIPEVKAAADRVTWTNDEWGVLREFQRL